MGLDVQGLATLAFLSVVVAGCAVSNPGHGFGSPRRCLGDSPPGSPDAGVRQGIVLFCLQNP